jgi:uncharacterized membrane protein YeaQ/YmgE (transglycosylase-associated protein family)
VRGTGFGIIGDLIVEILGAFIGSWLLPQLGIHLGTGVVSAIVNATIGAILLLLAVRLFQGGGGWGSRWRGGGVTHSTSSAAFVSQFFRDQMDNEMLISMFAAILSHGRADFVHSSWKASRHDGP